MLKFIFFISIPGILSVGNENDTSWNYQPGDKGPDNWPDLFPTCKDQKNGSPININDADTFSTQFEPFKFTYSNATNWIAENTGHSIQVNAPHNEDRFIFGSNLTDEYILSQFHFHWGDEIHGGAEHTLNGMKRYFAEIHLVHWREEYGSFEEAINHPDGIAVLGFFLTPGHDGFLSTWDHLIADIGMNDLTYGAQLNLTFSIEDLLPEDIDVYYRYFGSLTTPGCNEAVTWTIFPIPIIITDESHDLMSKWAKDQDGQQLDDNYRPQQKLNGRTVQYNNAVETSISLLLFSLTLISFR